MLRWFLMRSIARLTLLYIAAFIFFLLAGTSVSLMRVWITTAQSLAPLDLYLGPLFLESLSGTVPMATYMSSLLVLPSAAQRGINSFATGMLVLFLATFSLFTVTHATGKLIAAMDPSAFGVRIIPLGDEGLTLRSAGSIVSLIEGPRNIENGKAVIASGDDPLRLVPAAEAVAQIVPDLSGSPFAPSLRIPPSLAALGQDLGGSARRLSETRANGNLALLAYSAALALLISSFSPLAGATRWPFADLALCALAFRAVLIFENVATSRAVLRVAETALPLIPKLFLPAAILGSVGLFLAFVGSFLHILRGRRDTNG